MPESQEVCAYFKHVGPTDQACLVPTDTDTKEG